AARSASHRDVASHARQMAPLEHGERTTEKSEGWPAGCGPVRRRHKDVPSANPGGRTRILSTWMCSGRVRGVAFSLLRASCPPPFGPPSAFSRVPDARVVTFSWPSKRKSPARPGGARNKTGMSSRLLRNGRHDEPARASEKKARVGDRSRHLRRLPRLRGRVQGME